jgi:hypothetical protein
MTFDVERRFHLTTRPGRRCGGHRNVLQIGEEPVPAATSTAHPTGHEDRPHALARRMALAITAKRLIDGGVVADAAAMARIAGVTRARMTQILNLTLLAPDIQERLLDLTASDREATRPLGRLCAVLRWDIQRSRMRSLLGSPLR